MKVLTQTKTILWLLAIVTALVVLTPCEADAQGIVVTQRYTGLSPSGVNNRIVVGPLRNVGQTSHIVTIEFLDALQQPCLPYYDNTNVIITPQLELVASSGTTIDFPNIVTSFIAKPYPYSVFQTGLGNIKSYWYSGSGQYMFLAIQNLNTACTATIQYLGLVGSIDPPSYTTVRPDAEGSSLNRKWIQKTCTSGGTVTLVGTDPINPNGNHIWGIAALNITPTGNGTGVFELQQLDRSGAVSSAYGNVVVSGTTPTVMRTSEEPIMLTAAGSNIRVQCGNDGIINALVFEY